MRGAERISWLPGSVVEQILMFLPLREAVRTSVPSREWRNRWVDMPNLVLDDKFGKIVKSVAGGASSELALAANCKLMLDVFKVLMSHRGHLKEFSLSIPELRSSFPDHRIDQIIDFLDNQHIESLAIEIKDYVLPRGIYSFTRLRKLKLGGRQLTSSNLAFDSAAFAELDVLELRDLEVPRVGEACFSFNCSLLSALTMESCGHHANKISIVIEAPKLECFRLVGSFSLLEVKHTPLLKTVDVHRDFSINIKDKRQKALKPCEICRWSSSSGAALSLRLFLRLLMIGAEYVSKSCRLQSLPKLKHLRLNAAASSLHSPTISYARCAIGLMHISDGLTELTINLSTIGKQGILYGRIEESLHFLDNKYIRPKEKLKRAKVKRFHGGGLEMALVRLLLAAAPALDQMEIEFSAADGVEGQWSILKELFEFTRASPTAQIAIKKLVSCNYSQ